MGSPIAFDGPPSHLPAKNPPHHSQSQRNSIFTQQPAAIGTCISNPEQHALDTHTHTRKHPPETVSVGLITSACRCRHRGTLFPGKATISGHRVRGTQILPSNSHLLPTHTRTLGCGRKFNCILHVHGEAGRIIG